MVAIPSTTRSPPKVLLRIVGAILKSSTDGRPWLKIGVIRERRGLHACLQSGVYQPCCTYAAVSLAVCARLLLSFVLYGFAPCSERSTLPCFDCCAPAVTGLRSNGRSSGSRVLASTARSGSPSVRSDSPFMRVVGPSTSG